MRYKMTACIGSSSAVFDQHDKWTGFVEECAWQKDRVLFITIPGEEDGR